MLTEENLHNYQKVCINHILNTRMCGVFLEMGLGKTVLTLTAINALIYDYCEIDNALIIAPKRVAESVWQEEAENWSHLKHLSFSKIIGNRFERSAAIIKKANVYIISRDNVTWLCERCNRVLPFDMIVVDELSSFKSSKSKRFKSLKTCQPFFKRFVGLTGTPAPNGLIDLWPQIYLMDRGQRLGKTISSYRSTYFKPNKVVGGVVYNYALQSKESEELIRNKIKDICISMKAEDYIQMPYRTDNFIKLNLTKELLAKYREFEKEEVLQIINDKNDEELRIDVVNAAALSNKLLQFANGAIYDENRVAHEIHSIKIEALKEIIEDSNGNSVLVAWTYRFDRDRLLKELSKYKPRELKTPQDIIDWNNGKVQVMLAHPASAGHGLNLQTGGSIIVWFGLTWSLELYQQFNARLYRQGQKKHVIVNHLVMMKTHDEDVVSAIKIKEKTQNSLMESIKVKIEKYKKAIL